jgi:dTDP-4-dehydrorhamnose reductase
VQKTKVLITGSSGLLGSNLKVNLEKSFDVVGVARNHVPNFVDYPIDITNYKSLKDLLLQLKPEIVIHSAAIASHLLCDKEPEFAKKINFESTKNLVHITEEVGSKFIFISSDAVFKGDKEWYEESDETDPFSYYGELKVLAEQEVQKATENFIILRGSFFGNSLEGNKSIFEFFYNNLLSNNSVNGYTDIISNSLDVINFSKIVKALIDSEAKGLFHYGSSDKHSKYELGATIAKVAGLDINLINPLKSSDAGDPYFVARDLSLKTQKISKVEGVIIPNLKECVNEVFQFLHK